MNGQINRSKIICRHNLSSHGQKQTIFSLEIIKATFRLMVQWFQRLQNCKMDDDNIYDRCKIMTIVQHGPVHQMILKRNGQDHLPIRY